MEIDGRVRDAAYAHAMSVYPHECVGWIVRSDETQCQEYVPGENVHADSRHFFRTRAEDWVRAEASGEIMAFVHSHPDQPALASDADRLACHASALPWMVVVNGRDGVVSDFWIEPIVYTPPLIGRQYTPEVLDCWSLIRDWYREEMQVDLPDFPRNDAFVEDHEDLLNDRILPAGFAAISGDPIPGDIIIFRIGHVPVDNHLGVYIGGGMFLHHPRNALSRRDVYGGAWQRWTRKIVRRNHG